MKTPWALAVLLSGMSFSVYALQGKSPEAALEEMATAEKPEAIVRHLPEAVQKSIDELPKPQKQQVLDKLLSMKSEHLGGYTIRRASRADGWEIIDEDGQSQGKVTLGNVFVSGLDALVSLQLQSEDDSQTFMVAMRLEGDDWRIDDFGPWQKTNLHLRQLVHQSSELEKNEAAAKADLQNILMALYRYAQQYPQVGLPSRLSMLAGHEGQEPSVDHAGLLDEGFAAEPLIMDGYQFRYTLTRAGLGMAVERRLDIGDFQLIAAPIEFGKTGNRSYFLDSSGKITATAENRPATKDDPAPDDED
ncbi:MAG TPA: hypothetical protein VI488_02000 [Candidatus Angelobacter sp.]